MAVPLMGSGGNQFNLFHPQTEEASQVHGVMNYQSNWRDVRKSSIL